MFFFYLEVKMKGEREMLRQTLKRRYSSQSQSLVLHCSQPLLFAELHSALLAWHSGTTSAPYQTNIWLMVNLVYYLTKTVVPFKTKQAEKTSA